MRQRVGPEVAKQMPGKFTVVSPSLVMSLDSFNPFGIASARKLLNVHVGVLEKPQRNSHSFHVWNYNQTLGEIPTEVGYCHVLDDKCLAIIIVPSRPAIACIMDQNMSDISTPKVTTTKEWSDTTVSSAKKNREDRLNLCWACAEMYFSGAKITTAGQRAVSC